MEAVELEIQKHVQTGLWFNVMIRLKSELKWPIQTHIDYEHEMYGIMRSCGYQSSIVIVRV